VIAEGEGPSVNASRFRGEYGAAWEELDDLCRRLEKRGVRALGEEELLALPGLYRTALASLAAARAFSLDLALLTGLEHLCARAYFQIYGVPVTMREQLVWFLTRGWPQAVRALWRELAFCLALTVLGVVVGFWLVQSDPSAYYDLIPGGMSEGRDPAASTAALRATLYGPGLHPDQSWLAVFATFLFTHNAQVAIMAFALGFAFAVPTVLLIAYQGLMLGAMLAVFAAHGLGPDFAAWLTIHGTTELLAINIAGAAGLRIGLAAAFPGRAARMAAMTAAGRQAALAMAGVVAMLMVAGMLEGIGRQLVQDPAQRVAIGLVVLGGWVVFYTLGGVFYTLGGADRRTDAA
jgi:uncharacterized membrane protein SpoIIM required for sporulation